MFLCVFKNLNAGNFPSSAIQFIENKGQWEPNVLFKAELPIGNLFVEKNQLTYLFVDKEATHKLEHGTPLKSIHFHSVKVKFLGSNFNTYLTKDYKSKEYFNYFKGPEKNWASNVFAYKKIVFHNVYPNTDLELLAQPDGLKINFILAPGADPSLIKLQYEGAEKLEIINSQLRIKTSLGEWIEETPVSYQNQDTIQKVINTGYKLTNNIVSFELDSYQKDKVLLIDPSIIFGTYIGSAADNFGFAASFDAAGNAYGAGTVYESNFPVTTGAFDVNYSGGSSDNGEYARDAFLSKFNPNGSQLLFATFIGGAENEQPHSVTVSASNEIIIFGTTRSTDFATTSGAYDRSHNGSADIFICKLNSLGNTLIASTLFGGALTDGINGEAEYGFSSQPSPLPYNYADWFRGEVALDLSGNIIISTCTQSTQTNGLPVVNASQGTFGGGNQDGLLLKFSNNLSTLLFSTFIGGNGDDAIYSVSVNNLNEIIVGGGSTSSNLLFGSTTFTYNGGADGIIGKFSGQGVKQKLIYTGTTLYDQVFFVQTDNLNNIYTMGQTTGSMGKSTGVYGQINGKQFLQKYDQNLNNLLLKTVFGKAGPQPEISPSAFLVDLCGRIYISGWGGGTNVGYHQGMGYVNGLPTTPDAFQKTSYDGSDFYLMVLSPNFGSLTYATFYGGDQSQEHVDGGTSHFDKSGIVYQAVCAGCGGLSDFPTTPNAHSRSNPGKRAFNHNLGGCNLGIFKFDMRTYLNAPVFRDTVITMVAGTRLLLDFSATDINNDIMTFAANSLLFDKIPNAAFVSDTLSVPGKFSGKINWQSLCADVTGDTMFIELEFNDNACPTPNITIGLIKLLILSAPVPPPYPDCIQILGDNSVQLKWTATPVNDFGKFFILRSKNGNAINIYDSISNQNSGFYNDPNAIDNLNANFCYQIVALNSCRVAGDTSRRICSMQITDTSAAFTGMEDTLIVLRPFDSLNFSFLIESITPKDSVYLSIQGDFLKKGRYTLNNNSGFATARLYWRPGCTDIYKDTLHVNIIARNNQCPVWKLKTKAVRIVVIPLEKAPAPILACPRKFSADSFEIDWYKFKPLPFTSFIYLTRVINGLNQKILLKTDKLNQNSFIDVFNFDPDKKTCYYITSSDVCGFYGDTSALSCAQSNTSPAPGVELYTVTVQNDKELKLLWQKANPDSFWRYQVYKKTGRLTKNYLLYKTVEKVSDTVLIDEEVNVDKESYCYQLVHTDLCGNKSINNPPSCSILLNGKSFPFSHSLSWTSYDYWNAGVNHYELFKNEPGIYTDKFFTRTENKVLNSSDNNLNYDNGLYEYTIVAVENTNGNSQNSRSNTIDLIQPPLLYTPNAYTDNGDGINDMYKMVPVFVKDFYLQIFNRWGERIFETHDKKQGFNSTYKSREIQEEVYFFIVTYTGWDESVHTKKGNFTLLR
ncbi:MAG: gliding motility-associated C-terminal domain-containing protein [Bacteroidia bacterium]|nr:gliding motility-associated C-terminal domain-containing protein [Bacteroidia bacterium]